MFAILGVVVYGLIPFATLAMVVDTLKEAGK